MKKLTNVVIVNDFDYTQGGASKVAIDTANLLVENDKNLNVYFFSAAHDDTSILNDKVIRVCTNQGEALRDKNKIRGFFNGIYNFKAKRELKKLLKTLDKEKTVIHVHGWTKCLSSSVFDIAFKMNFKVVLTLHDYFTACPNGGFFNYKKNEICHLKPLSWKCIKCNCDSRNYVFKLYRILRQFVQSRIVKLNKKLENIITISDFSEKILKQFFNENVKITRIYNPIDIDTNGEKADFINNDYFLYVGRISKEKGVDLFCQAITDLNLKGIVVGDGDEKLFLEKKYPDIEFVGWKNRDDVKKYILGAKALIFPSKCYETMGLSVVESLKLGVPVIVSDNTAASDFVIDNVNGYKFNDIVSLKKILESKILNIKNIDYSFENNYFGELIHFYIDLNKKY